MSSNIKQSKSWKENFAQFFESLSRETLRELLRNPTGEYDDLDFKRELVSDDEIAKDILGMVNKSGGAVIFSVEEKKEDNSFNSKGLSDLNDKTDFKNKVEKYLPSQLDFDGFKRHIAKDLDIGIVRAVGITSANAPEASVTLDIESDLKQQQVTIQELHIDRAYLTSHLVKQRTDDLTIICKAWKVRNGKLFDKNAFVLDWDNSLICCPLIPAS